MKGFSTQKPEKIAQLPKSPGVYAFLRGKELLYIGKAANIRFRVRSHFEKGSWRDSLFMDQVDKVAFKETSSDIDALLLESQLIQKEQPKYNVLWRDNKSYLSVLVSSGALPMVSLIHSRQKQEKGLLIGPFVDGKAIRRALRILRGVFPYYTTNKHPRVPCQYCHLGLCPGTDPDKKKYLRDIRSLIAVLRGEKTSVLKKLGAHMNQASKNQRYEEAAKLRDQSEALQRIFEHSFILSSIERNRREEQKGESAEIELQELLGASQKIQRIEGYDISNIQGNQATGSMVVFQNGKPEKSSYRKFKIKRAGKPDDFAMMGELISRRMNHKEWRYADLMLIDGGKGQLSSALEALNLVRLSYPHLNRTKFQVAALAKQQNELFLPEKKESILLSSLSPEVHNLLMHVRDEAHRFAITYHRKLIAKREK